MDITVATITTNTTCIATNATRERLSEQAICIITMTVTINFMSTAGYIIL